MTSSVSAQLHAALKLTVTPKGHHPDCPHRQWRNDWDNRSRHECDVEGCDRTGQPCSKRCAQVRAALRLDPATPARAAERPVGMFDEMEVGA